MGILSKTAWRNIFRQRRRSLITLSAMALSLIVAIPTYGLMEGMRRDMQRAITGMELGHVQLHDRAYPQGRSLQSTLTHAGTLLAAIEKQPEVKAAAPRVHGFALASHERELLVRLHPIEAASGPYQVRFGRGIDRRASWRTDPALACEVLAAVDATSRHGVRVGSVLTPKQPTPGGRCEQLRVVGLLAQPLPSAPSELPLLIAAEDRRAAFGQEKIAQPMLARHAAALSLFAVDPRSEARVSFMPSKVIKGRYLSPKARGEIVVGEGLATSLGLHLGAKLFLQAATLDQTQGAFYRDFELVGIYRTGIDPIDRSRAFLHLKDAQALMALAPRIHEIVVVGRAGVEPRALAANLRRILVAPLLVAPGGDPGGLPAPLRVYPRAQGGTRGLLVPYDLKRRFEQLPGLRAVGRRVYGQTLVISADKLKLTIVAAPTRAAGTLGVVGPAPCTLALRAASATRLRLHPGELLYRGDALAESCRTLRVGTLLKEPGEGALLVDPPPELLGEQTFYRARGQRSLRFAGVEAGLEAPSALPLLTGAALPSATPEGLWPLLLRTDAASSLGLTLGGALLLKAKDEDGRLAFHPARLVGLLDPQRFPAAQAPLILPFFCGQELDVPRLNARAHELVLWPKGSTDLPALLRSADQLLLPLVRSWQQIAPDLAKMLETQDVWMGIFMLIIFGIAAMTVMNTMLMVVFERTREFGVLKAIGMRPGQVFALIVLETLALAGLAALVGGSAGFLLNELAVRSGLDLRQWTGGFSYQGTFINPVLYSMHSIKAIALPIGMVLLVCLVVSFYPAWRAARLRPIDALRQHR